ncbi:hypothetical protein ABE65_011215 [Fictibacillus phosphorivorans]|uniref:Peptidase M14 domain-containing protein n=1 Tax=Fictibacillus phosphorivorans TaxID=1221500 RepID=A0A160IP04_9BACL|nr:M14 family zinc carboxypeptidase [Fictibacillus phosphorivorans]ANC77342.1 hypothetical protein ABE65_011215 [Fictibacillus phosphorivorans]
MKRPLLSTLLSVSLLAGTLPATHVLAEGDKAPVRKHSLFNSEKYDYITFDSLKDKLTQFEKTSKRIDLRVTGKSSTGKNLYTVTIGDNESKRSAEKYKTLRKLMSDDPKKAQNYLKVNPDVKAPILIHASIHGTEFVGTDAVIKLIERFGFENDKETKEILKNFTLIINVNANPDGRIDATRFNAEGIDLNRDFVTQSQPETKAVVKQIVEYNPLVLLDLHGYVKQRGVAKHPGLILPGTPPHNPNYEYDLLYNWMNQQAEAMESELVSERKNYESELYQSMEGTHIPLRDSASGWDVYPPIYTPAYAMLHGGYGYTLEAPTNDWDGVKWQVDAVTGALKFALQNKQGMLHDQIEVFDRGVSGEHPNNSKEFYPEAYVIPENKEDNSTVKKAVQHLINNDVQVDRSEQPFFVNGKKYDKGSYIVDLDQAKAGLANTFLWDGEDISDDIDAMYDISAWNLPELWGFDAVETNEEIKVKSTQVKKVEQDGKLKGKGPYFVSNNSVDAVELVNALIKRGVSVKRDTKGNFYIEGNKEQVKKEVKKSSLTLVSKRTPDDAVALKRVRVAILKDGGLGKVQSHAGTKLALERLGFDVTEVHPKDVAQRGLNRYDAFVYSGSASLISYKLSEANKEFGLSNEEEVQAFYHKLKEFVSQNGKFVAIGAGGSQIAKTAGLTDVEIHKGFSSANGIVHIAYEDSPVTRGYKDEDTGFVYSPVWYTHTDNVNVAATFANRDDFFVAGHWKDRKPAQGQAVIIQERSKSVTLIGIEAGFRNHTDYLFRLISNSLY